jgi:hypothetical protein
MYLGCDPEFGIWDKAEGKWVPAFRAFPGREDKLPFNEGRVKMFRDGFSVEVNTAYPYDCAALLMTAIARGLSEAKTHIAKTLGGAEGRYALLAPGAIIVDADTGLPPDSPADVLQVGCHPSFNIYDEWVKPLVAPWTPQTHDIRMFSGHMHFSRINGIPDIHDRAWVEKAVRALDLTVGLVSTVIFGAEPLEFTRRSFYGRAGEFRLQTYGSGPYAGKGLEYRTPSAVIWRHPAITGLMLALARTALKDPDAILDAYRKEWDLDGTTRDQVVQNAINTGVGAADLLLPHYTHGWAGSDYSDEGEARMTAEARARYGAIAKWRNETQTWVGEPPSELLTREALGLPAPPPALSDGKVSKAAILKLAELRSTHFGPDVEPLLQGPAPERTGHWPGGGFHHYAWPEYPRRAWKKDFDGIEV